VPRICFNVIHPLAGALTTFGSEVSAKSSNERLSGVLMGQTPLVQIKGMRDGLLATLGEASWTELRVALMAQIDDRQSFFQGARMALDVGNHVLHVADLAPLRDTLSERGVTLWAILSDSPVTEGTAQILGLATRLAKPKREPERPVPEEKAEDAALWVHRTLRSGTRIDFPGHVAVFGDVNPGAEIVAGGSVMVWGRLRGVVHAGAQGDREAVVCALDLSPTQLRIADEIAITPQREGQAQPEIVRLKEGRLQAEPWEAE
jgi:septum site-determining protein MinC